MTKLLLLSERFPLVLDFTWLVVPLLSDDLGNLRICETRVLRNDLGLVMLAIENEGFNSQSLKQIVNHHQSHIPLRGLGIFGSG